MVVRRQRGQVLAFVTPIIAVFTLLAALALSYGTLTLRAMRAMAVADTAAHAGAMEIHVLPNGKIVDTAAAERVAARAFAAQAPSYARLQSVQCGYSQQGPFCDLTVLVHSNFLFSAEHVVEVRSVLAYGVTRGGQ